VSHHELCFYLLSLVRVVQSISEATDKGGEEAVHSLPRNGLAQQPPKVLAKCLCLPSSLWGLQRFFDLVHDEPQQPVFDDPYQPRKKTLHAITSFCSLG